MYIYCAHESNGRAQLFVFISKCAMISNDIGCEIHTKRLWITTPNFNRFGALIIYSDNVTICLFHLCCMPNVKEEKIKKKIAKLLRKFEPTFLVQAILAGRWIYILSWSNNEIMIFHYPIGAPIVFSSKTSIYPKKWIKCVIPILNTLIEWNWIFFFRQPKDDKFHNKCIFHWI